MSRWLPALVVAALIVLIAPARFRHRAFRRGWFERSFETDRRRRERRPTHGGVVAAVALAAGALFASGDTRLAALAALGLSLAAAVLVERRRSPVWMLRATRAAVALAIPLAGVRAELTGHTGVDVALTALVAFGVMAGLAAVDHTDATVPVVVAAPAVGLLIAAVRDDILGPAALAAAVAGVALGLLAHTLPPGDLHLGRTGPTALGAALTVAAVEFGPATGEPRLALAGLLALAVPLLAPLVAGFDLRLADRHVAPTIGFAIAGACGAVAAVLLSGGDLDPIPATALALGPAVALLLLAATTPPPEELAPAAWWRTAMYVGIVVVGISVAVPAALALRSARTATWAMSTAVAEEAMVSMLWCSAYQTRR